MDSFLGEEKLKPKEDISVVERRKHPRIRVKLTLDYCLVDNVFQGFRGELSPHFLLRR